MLCLIKLNETPKNSLLPVSFATICNQRAVAMEIVKLVVSGQTEGIRKHEELK